MAGCFAFQKLSSMSRLRSLLSAYAPAAVRPSTPATRTVSVSRHFNTTPCSSYRKDDQWTQIMWLCWFSCVSCSFGMFFEDCTASIKKDRSSSRPRTSSGDRQDGAPKS